MGRRGHSDSWTCWNTCALFFLVVLACQFGPVEASDASGMTAAFIVVGVIIFIIFISIVAWNLSACSQKQSDWQRRRALETGRRRQLAYVRGQPTVFVTASGAHYFGYPQYPAVIVGHGDDPFHHHSSYGDTGGCSLFAGGGACDSGSVGGGGWGSGGFDSGGGCDSGFGGFDSGGGCDSGGGGFSGGGCDSGGGGCDSGGGGGCDSGGCGSGGGCGGMD